MIHLIDQSLFARRTIAAIAADADPPPGADDRDPKLQINCRKGIDTRGPSSTSPTMYLTVDLNDECDQAKEKDSTLCQKHAAQ